MIGHLLDLIDSCLAWFLVDAARVVCWAMLAGAGSMGIYAAASPQRRLKALEEESNAARRALSQYDGDFAGAWPLIRNTVATPLRRLALALRPSLLAGVPVIAVLIWSNDRYGYAMPRPGETIAVEVLPAMSAASWEPDAAAVAGDDGLWRVRWPESDQPIRLLDARGVEMLELPGTESTTWGRPEWWRLLFSSRTAALPPQSQIESVSVQYPQREYVSFGPKWARSFLTVFLLATCVSSLAVKFAFRIA